MKIVRVKAHAMSMKLDKVYWTSRGAWGTYNTIVVEVETSDGLIGLGTINKTPLRDIAEIVDALGPVIKGMDALAHEAVWDKIFNLTVPHLEAGKSDVTRPKYEQNKRVNLMAALAGIDLALGQLGLHAQAGQRRLQLVRCVSEETLLGAHRLVQSRQQVVDGADQRRHLLGHGRMSTGADAKWST